MKKITALILLAALLLSLAACGGTQSSGGSAVTAPEQATPEATETPAPEETTPEADAEADTEPSDDETDEAEAPSEPVLGVYHEDTYTYENELIGLGCKLDEEWHVFNQEEIATLNGMMSEMLTDEAIAEQLENSGYVQAFYAQLGQDPVTVNITVENLGLLYGSLLDEREYVELTVDQLPAVLESMGLTDITSEITTMTFLDGEHTAVNVTGQLQGTDFYETLVCVKVNRYMACVTAASYLADVTGDILDMFYSL